MISFRYFAWSKLLTDCWIFEETSIAASLVKSVVCSVHSASNVTVTINTCPASSKIICHISCLVVLAIFTARKRSLGQGNVFTLHQANTPTLGRPPSGRHPRADTPQVDTPWADTSPLLDTSGYGQQVGSTHPTWIHTCYQNMVENLKQKNHLSTKPIKMLLCLTRVPFSQAPWWWNSFLEKMLPHQTSVNMLFLWCLDIEGNLFHHLSLLSMLLNMNSVIWTKNNN